MTSLARPGETILDAREHAADTSCADLTNHAVDALAVGGSFLLVADHDPVGLQYMLAAERPGQVQWNALEDGPTVWQARITRVTER